LLKLDSHVHTQHSGQTTIYPLSLVTRESYNTPEGVYRLAKARGMDLVTITDHDQVSGALSRFNRERLYDLVQRPARLDAPRPHLAV
jgi:predicted metal-dependent phosphoesterase TrpH